MSFKDEGILSDEVTLTGIILIILLIVVGIIREIWK